MERKVLLTIEIDNDNAIKNAAAFEQAIANLKNEQKELAKQFASGTLTQDQYNQALVKNKAELRANQTALRELNKTIDLNIKAANAQEGSYDSLSAQYSLLKQQINALGVANEEDLKQKQALELQASRLYEEMNRLQKETGKHQLGVARYNEGIEEAVRVALDYDNTLKGMRERLKQVGDLLQTLDVDSEEFKQAKSDFDNLSLSIAQAEGKLNEFGEREPKNPVKKMYEDAFSAAGALTSGITLLNTAMGENENLAQFQAKSLQAIAIAQNVTNIVKEKGAIIDTAALIRTKAITAAQRLWTLAVGQSTGAMKALRVALISTGIGALIVGIGLLSANFKEVNGWIDSMRTKLRDFIKGIVGSEEAAKWLAYSLELIISPLTLIISGINELGKIVGLVEVQKLTTDIDALNKSLERSEAQFERNNRKLQDNIALMKAQGKDATAIANKEIELLRKRADQWNQYDKKVQQHVANIRASGRQLTDDEQKALDDFNKKVADANLALAVREAEIAKERNNKAKEKAKERTKIEQELQNEINALRAAIITDEFERRNAEINEQKRLAEQAAKQQIEELKKSGVLTETIREKINERLKLQQKQFNKQLEQVEKDRIKRIEEAEKASKERREQLYQQTVDGRLEAIDTALQNELELFNANSQVLEKTERGRLQRVRQLTIEELNIRKRAVEQQLQILIEFANKYGEEAEEERKKIEQLKQILAGLNSQLYELQNTADAVTLADALGINKEQLESAKNGLQQVADFANQINELINAGFQVRLNQIDAEYNAREEAIRNSTMSEKQKQKALEKVEKERALKRWKIEKEQFEANQATAIVNAIIQGALAVVTALAQLGPIAGAIAATLIGATTAAQIAVIASQPPPPKPQFFDGGYTEQSGNPRMRSAKASNSNRDIHHNEYVVPWKVLSQPQAIPLVQTLEAMRLNTPGRIGISGFADGGFASRSIENNALRVEQIAQVVIAGVKNAKIVTRVTDINRVQKDVAQNRVMAEL